MDKDEKHPTLTENHQTYTEQLVILSTSCIEDNTGPLFDYAQCSEPIVAPAHLPAHSLNPRSTITPPPLRTLSSHIPPRLRRRDRRRRRASRQHQSIFAAAYRRLIYNQDDNHPEETIDTSGTATLASSSTVNQTTNSNTAVRVLFREHQIQLRRSRQPQANSGCVTLVRTRPRLISRSLSDDSRSLCGPNECRLQLANLQSPASIIDLNRQLIERQIETIREANSRRWNFDFGNCLPLDQIAHGHENCTIVHLNNNDINVTNNNNPVNDSSITSSISTFTRNPKPFNDKN